MVAEHLKLAANAAVVEPLTAKLRRSLAARFRRQLAAAIRVVRRAATKDDAKQAIGPAIRSVHLGNWRRTWSTVTRDAYQGAASVALRSLGLVATGEAKGDRRKPEPATLPTWYARMKGLADKVETLEDQIDSTTEDRIALVVEDTWASGTREIEATIRGMVSDWIEAKGNRADTIAGDVVARAFNQGTRDAGKTAGIQGKRWMIEPDACEVCVENSDMGAIDMDAPFSSGDWEPPAHPNCRCSLDLVDNLADEDEDEGEGE